MPDDAERPIQKRKRVSTACDSCRAKKAKCDGRRPVCGRCDGYDFTCTWTERDRHRTAVPPCPAALSTVRDETLGMTFSRYQQLVRRLCDSIPEESRVAVEESLARIQAHIGEAGSPGSSAPRPHTQRYLGEVSDIHFFNLVKRTFRDDPHTPDQAEEGIDSYDQEESLPTTQVKYELSVMPDASKCDDYLDAYFTTIHIAYPFVVKSSFMESYHSLRSGESDDVPSPAWLSLLYALLAIGAYYTSFPGHASLKDLSHQKYFQRSLYLAGFERLERSPTQVSALLAQCFYSLATSRTDRCWITLGLAVRLGQSLGLHVDTEDGTAMRLSPGRGFERAETRRRVWYSLYVLDRLIALQLGRPPAISDEDCHVSLPSRIDDSSYHCDSEPLPSIPIEEESTGEYFIWVIKFSTILGQVLRDLCHPRRDVAGRLLRSKSCDESLLAWKQELPRFLRFDIGHAFEKSVTFRRQRNLLAIKFHHLRALIHRPYLGLSLLKGVSEEYTLGDQASQVQYHEQICILEAQETARLLHNVRDERELVHDYPWWQMISCLVCAGSILIAAEAIGRQRTDRILNVATLGDDAETCLRVFEALSHNSDGARMAMDMLRKLKAQSLRVPDPSRAFQPPHELRGSQPLPTKTVAQYPASVLTATPPYPFTQGIEPVFPAPMPSGEHVNFTADQDTESNSWGSHFQNSNMWPLEIVDSMAWSTQLFDVLQQGPGTLAQDAPEGP